MTRLYGRAPTGERVLGSVPQNYGPKVTILGALGVHGLHAVMTVDGATDTVVFRTYVKRVLAPTLTPGDIVVMDNLRAHKAVGVQQALASVELVCCTCRLTRRTCRPLSPVGPRSRRRCAKPRRARVRPSTGPSQES